MKLKTWFCQNLFIVLFFSMCLNAHRIAASDCGGPVLQMGWFIANQGKSQHINMEGLIGDNFDVSKSSDQNFFVGAGYYFYGLDLYRNNKTDFSSWFDMSILYGLNAFYLGPIKVKGNVTQEDLFTNLSYSYSQINYPIYCAVKALIHCNMQHDFVIDLGIGPNIILAKSFREHSLDGGVTIPDAHMFSSKTSVAFSAMMGLGWRLNQFLSNYSLEIGYRFFYLGEGEFKKGNSQIKNSLRTGNSYANALFFSISL